MGLAVLLVGAALLSVVVALAWQAFSGLPAAVQGKPLTLERVGGLVAVTAARACLLIAMAYAASLLASKGIELYAVSSGRPIK